ncbi:MAG: response regulator [Spirochaetes bacterium]|nr:response regulator [Spirochaetota bacterium]
MKNNRPILLVEDDKIDVLIMKRALKEINVTNRLDIAENGEEALTHLKNPNNEKPGIILLDLNMPRMNGIEFLKIAKEDKNLKIIPVIVLTTSKEEQDKINSFNLGIAGYMYKPIDYQDFVKLVRTINQYWTLSQLP